MAGFKAGPKARFMASLKASLKASPRGRTISVNTPDIGFADFNWVRRMGGKVH